MPTHTWTIKLEEAYAQSKKHWDKLKLLREIDRRAYFEGFKVGRERQMFEEELKDLELVYKSTLNQVNKSIKNCLPSLLHYMGEFVGLHEQYEAVSEKLETLLAKNGKGEESDGEDDE